MIRFPTLLDAVAHLHRSGFRADMSDGAQPDSGLSFHFWRNSWLAVVTIQKNGRACVVTY